MLLPLLFDMVLTNVTSAAEGIVFYLPLSGAIDTLIGVMPNGTCHALLSRITAGQPGTSRRLYGR